MAIALPANGVGRLRRALKIRWTGGQVLACHVALLGAFAVTGCGEETEREPVPVPLATLDYDRSAPLRTAVEPARRAGPVTFQRLSFVAFDGERIPGLVARPAGPPSRSRADRGPCLLAVAGLRGRKETFGEVAEAAAAAGFTTLAIDARAHGERGTPAQIDAIVRSAPRLARLVRETVLDLRRALDLLARERTCDPRRLGFLGGSLGGLAGAVLAGADARVGSAVLLVAGAGWREIFEAQDLFLPGIEDDPEALDAAVAHFAPYAPERWVARIAPRPVLLVNGREDQYVPVADAERLHRAARTPKEVLWYPGDHAWTRDPDVLPATIAFLRRTLPAR